MLAYVGFFCNFAGPKNRIDEFWIDKKYVIF